MIALSKLHIAAYSRAYNFELNVDMSLDISHHRNHIWADRVFSEREKWFSIAWLIESRFIHCIVNIQILSEVFVDWISKTYFVHPCCLSHQFSDSGKPIRHSGQCYPAHIFLGVELIYRTYMQMRPRFLSVYYLVGPLFLESARGNSRRDDMK